MPNFILRVAVTLPVDKLFDYLSLNNINVMIGARVIVPFGPRILTGMVLDKVDASDYPIDKLKSIKKVLDQQSLLTPALLYLLHWSANYYCYPVGMVLQTLLPTLLNQGKSASLKQHQRWRITETGSSALLSLTANAHKQKRILSLCQSYKTDDNLKQQGISSSDLKKLQQRNWLSSEFYYPLPKNNESPDVPHQLNSQQQQVIEQIHQNIDTFQCYLIDGITGSGKTEIYLQLIQHMLDQGKQSLILIPEINLTPQTLKRFQARFKVPVVILNSKLNNNERLQAWLQAKENIASIILGTRSALWTPLPQLGLIIVDEEHDGSYKQQNGLLYSARDLAIVLAQYHQIPIILGTATPSLQSLYQVQQGRYQRLELSIRAGGAQLAEYQLIDLRQQKLKDGFSKTLLTEIKHCLAKKQQILVYINRRGYAPTYMCYDCAWISECAHCQARHTYHAEDKRLHCHHCGAQQAVMTHCPECQSSELKSVGYGSERISNALTDLFPNANILRIDSDSTRQKNALEEMLDQIQHGDIDILVGTQMLAKGHHFPKVSLVAVINIDNGLFSLDFRASEQMAQNLIQVAGRSGRAQIKGKVLIQTHHPEHPLLKTLVESGYADFAAMALQERQAAELPPYHFLALLQVESKKIETRDHFLQQAYDLAIPVCETAEVDLIGPLDAPMPLRANYHRGQLLFQSDQRSTLHQALNQWLIELKQLPKYNIRWQLNIDPQNLY